MSNKKEIGYISHVDPIKTFLHESIEVVVKQSENKKTLTEIWEKSNTHVIKSTESPKLIEWKKPLSRRERRANQRKANKK